MMVGSGTIGISSCKCIVNLLELKRINAHLVLPKVVLLAEENYDF
jgi:hypothetical protein